MSPDSNHWRRRRRGPGQKKPRGPKPKPNASHPKCRLMPSPAVRCSVKIFLHDISCQPGVSTLTAGRRLESQLPRPHKLVRWGVPTTFGARALPGYESSSAPWKEISDVCAGDPPPHMGGRLGRRLGPEPRGDPRHTGDRARFGEPVARRKDPELSGRLLPDHPGLPPVAPAPAGPFA